MNARKYLESLAEAQERIKLNQDRVQTLNESLTSLSAPMDKEQVSHTKNVSIMADTVARIIDMEHEIDQQTAELYSMQQRARIYLNLLKPVNSQILNLRYIEHAEYEDICKIMGYSQSSVFRFLRDAIKELQDLFDSLGIESP